MTRALVLGGGGVTGIAWEVGVLAGLLDAGLDLSGADAVFGTSAGAFVGAAVAGGADLGALLAAQSEPSEEVAAAATEALYLAWYQAYVDGGDDPAAVGRGFGRIGREHPEPVSHAVRRAVVEARLTTQTWPASLRVVAIEATTGELTVFDADGPARLVEAVSASGAVPGVWPLVTIDGTDYVDGGMVSSANARLAAGFDQVVVIAPLPIGYGAIPGVEADVATLPGRTCLLVPDEATVEAIGPNIDDPTRRGAAAAAGRAQGRSAAQAVAGVWG